ncbi:hypothetical protein JDO7802_00182 [Jannaschia donghaensis]|uniref:Uncharacterized protein n=1 Tax=Jannaschia donghaensis TaxID=420998 RepID=A0A0M6YDX4_9RHOB|nr:hypothetical protein JDO7802_00182 [Jannaschia donghaensis]
MRRNISATIDVGDQINEALRFVNRPNGRMRNIIRSNRMNSIFYIIGVVVVVVAVINFVA